MISWHQVVRELQSASNMMLGSKFKIEGTRPWLVTGQTNIWPICTGVLIWYVGTCHSREEEKEKRRQWQKKGVVPAVVDDGQWTAGTRQQAPSGLGGRHQEKEKGLGN